MAKKVLPTNFKNDILAEQMGSNRRYQMINNSDGTVSFVDVTTYDQVGSEFGAAQVNNTNAAVNESFDKNKVIGTLADVMANTQVGYVADALAVKQINSSLIEGGGMGVGYKYVVNNDGAVIGYKTTQGGDKVFSINSIGGFKEIGIAIFDYQKISEFDIIKEDFSLITGSSSTGISGDYLEVKQATWRTTIKALKDCKYILYELNSNSITRGTALAGEYIVDDSDSSGKPYIAFVTY